MASYILRGGLHAAKRLSLLSRVKWPTTRSLLRLAGLGPGMSCLDVGCGRGLVSLRMAAEVGPTGRVVGIDRDELLIGLANRDAARLGLPATFRHQGLDEFDEADTFDLAFTRFLLSHLPRPAEAAARIARAVKPGGVVVAEDVDFPGHFCHPACSAFDRYVALYQAVASANGGDPTIGPKLFGVWQDLGLVDVRVRLVQPMFAEGEGTLVAAMTLEHIREAVVAAGFASDGELDELVAELVDFASTPTSLISLPRIFQVCGRVPGPGLSPPGPAESANEVESPQG